MCAGILQVLKLDFLKGNDILPVKQKKFEDLNLGIYSFDRVFLMKRNFGIVEELPTST
jgi:hypothetical protein